MSLEQPTGLAIQSDLEQGDETSGIYTHSVRTRAIVFYLLLMYATLMTLFMMTLKGRFDRMRDLPEVFRQGSDGFMMETLFPVIAVISALFAAALLIYLLWWAIDIWGLEVEVNTNELVVRNTLLGSFLASRTGVGRMPLEDVAEIKGGKFATRVVGTEAILRFSPVHKVDKLIAFLIAHAPNARIT